ncbi:helix-hairpin-helix domain-containing protein [Sphingomonas kyeonggiensis]|uniref:Putative flap endonuclease-1-like 5' DNA nuclease n=1 Tax=Sphingomonas kyeonggiensis TaxID=1268553 RepID=A0A7W6JV41_9SPHN|nr:helix-hairpin-helix domain-containing protein [Sphingomonas kyeonggiensis]MBB4100122.1 putative flap endonuclease-1-like 5' DNA nuclease [Sphingomonas kyeonggiensis]
MNSTEPLYEGAPIWLTLPFALIAVGVVFALLVLFWGARLAGRRRRARAEIEEYNQEYREESPAQPITPPVAPSPPPIAEAPLAPPPPAPEPVAEAPAPAPEPVAEIVPAPLPPVVEEAPAPEPLADEPIAAAAPLDASPASLASDIAEPTPAPEPAPVAAEPAPVAPAGDDLTRMKGVGPRLAERLASVGITSFAQLAALTPEEADALDAKLGDFQGRIHRDRWIEQASFLAKDDIAGFEGVFGKL